MTPPRLSTFRERLDEALRDARQGRGLDPAAFERLLVDPEFDDDEFDGFRAAAGRAGIVLPDEADAEEAPAAPGPAASASPRERDLFDRYLDEIGRIPLLQHEELLVLAVRVRRGDESARRRIILANLRLVVHLARAYRYRGLPMLDLIEEGNLGLIHAVDRFEPERGLRFSTYAAIWIRQSMLRGLAEQSRAIRIPVQMFQQVSRFMRAERELRMRDGREPTLDEIAGALDISRVRVERLAALLGGLRSLDDETTLDAFERVSEDARVQVPVSVERIMDFAVSRYHRVSARRRTVR